MELAAAYAPQNFYFYVVDSKSDRKFRQRMNDLASCLPNVFITEEFEIDGGGKNHNYAILAALKFLTNYKWNYVTSLQVCFQRELSSYHLTAKARSPHKNEHGNVFHGKFFSTFVHVKSQPIWLLIQNFTNFSNFELNYPKKGVLMIFFIVVDILEKNYKQNRKVEKTTF